MDDKEKWSREYLDEYQRLLGKLIEKNQKDIESMYDNGMILFLLYGVGIFLGLGAILYILSRLPK